MTPTTREELLSTLRLMHDTLSLPEPHRTEKVARYCFTYPELAQEQVGLCSLLHNLTRTTCNVKPRHVSQLFEDVLVQLYGKYSDPFKQFGKQYSYFAETIDWDFRRDKLVEIIAHVEAMQ